MMTIPATDMARIGALDFAAAARKRRRSLLFVSLLLTLLLGASYVSLGEAGPVLPTVVILSIAIPLLLWHSTALALNLFFGAACLIELFPSGYADAITDRIPLFWNVNTIVQTYLHANFKAVPFSLFEVLLMMTGVFSLLRAVFTRSVSLRGGPLLIPLSIYLSFVVWGWINGLANGGDFKLSLQEVRAQLYFGVAYFMAVNIVREERQYSSLCWLMALCFGLKGILYTFRRYVTIAGQPLPDQGVGSHEEALFFVCFILLMLALFIVNDPKHRRLLGVMLLLTPFVILGNLATNRRAGTAAFILAVPLLLLLAYQAYPRCRRIVAAVALTLAVLGPIYYAAFRNSESAIAQPARAIKSQFTPDARDASSNAYRDAENADQMATIHVAPITGYGYGRRMLHAVPIADISDQYEWWDLLPHNQVLWVWMRLGTPGFVAFWMMISAAAILTCRTARNEANSSTRRTLGLFCVGALTALLIFGLLDLQLSNFRSMLFMGFLLGALGDERWLP